MNFFLITCKVLRLISFWAHIKLRGLELLRFLLLNFIIKVLMAILVLFTAIIVIII